MVVDRRPLLTFAAAGRRLALPLEDIRRVVPLPLLQTPAGAPQFVEGFFDYVGSPVAVVRVDRLLGLGEERLGIYSPLLVLKSEDPPIALHVGRVLSILKPTDAELQPIGEDETFNACVIARVSIGGDTVYVLSSKALLLTEERATVAAHHATRRQRLEALPGAPAPGEHALAS